ncbi:MAG: diguanylate cyclase [Chloroflexaceae bacterium]|nr:diguanylate cyclase [Chloroflexaceae bacterium]
MRVLIVDDDPIHRRLLQASLKTAHDVYEADDGQAAWELLQRESFHFVITDWMMPQMDGVDLIRNIRASNWISYTYIILVTAKGNRHDMIEGLESGADDYMIKPFDQAELRARMTIGERILNLEMRLRELATHDYLTALLNRRAIYDEVNKELQRARRTGYPLSLIMLDIDHFKKVNDTHGHLVGDEALCLVANTLKEGARSYDTVGRWGGEEFLILLPETSLLEASQVAERVRISVSTTSLVLPDQSPLHVQISLGVTSTSIGQLTNGELPALNMLLQQADDALLLAKRTGRNRVCVFGRMSVPDSVDRFQTDER